MQTMYDARYARFGKAHEPTPRETSQTMSTITHAEVVLDPAGFYADIMTSGGEVAGLCSPQVVNQVIAEQEASLNMRRSPRQRFRLLTTLMKPPYENS